MKSSVGLAVLARVIPYCVHGGVAGQHRGKCVIKEKNQLVTRQSRSFLIPQSSLKFTIFLNDFALSGFLFSDSKQPN